MSVLGKKVDVVAQPIQATLRDYAVRLALFGIAFGIASLVSVAVGDWIIVNSGDLWQSGFPVFKAFWQVKILPLWGVGMIGLVSYIGMKKGDPRPYDPATTLRRGSAYSVISAVCEEIMYRWWGFFTMMVVVRVLNILPFGIVEWLFTEVVSPISNVLLFHKLEPQLMEANWALGAAMVAVSWVFVSGHLRIGGFLSWAASWYLSMLMFYVMFNYGIVTAMGTHALIVLCTFWFRALMYSMWPARNQDLASEPA